MVSGDSYFAEVKQIVVQVARTFVKSFFSVAKTGFNMVGVNSINRVATVAYYDGDGWVENVKVPA